MAGLQREVFEAFRCLGIPEEKALAAAAALSRRDEEVVAVKRQLLTVKLMLGFTLALVLGVLFLMFRR